MLTKKTLIISGVIVFVIIIVVIIIAVATKKKSTNPITIIPPGQYNTYRTYPLTNNNSTVGQQLYLLTVNYPSNQMGFTVTGNAGTGTGYELLYLYRNKTLEKFYFGTSIQVLFPTISGNTVTLTSQDTGWYFQFLIDGDPNNDSFAWIITNGTTKYSLNVVGLSLQTTTFNTTLNMYIIFFSNVAGGGTNINAATLQITQVLR
jgi:hypothetical protein